MPGHLSREDGGKDVLKDEPGPGHRPIKLESLLEVESI